MPRPPLDSPSTNSSRPAAFCRRRHPAYEFRRGQLQMAQAVEEALEEKRHLIVGGRHRYRQNAGVSAARHPLRQARHHFDRHEEPAGAALLQRRSISGARTLPRRRPQAFRLLHEGPQQLSLPQKALRPHRPARPERSRRNRTLSAPSPPGRKPRTPATAPNSPNCPRRARFGTKLDARADTCLGQKCKEYDRCFITEMRRRAAESDIIIVNHHLFFADLAIKLEAEHAPDAGVLPDAGAVIFDEAHELEDVAGNYFGISVSNFRMDELARDTENLLQREKLYTPQMSGAIQSLRERSQLFFSLLPAQEGRFAFDTRREFLEENGEEFIALHQSLQPPDRRVRAAPAKARRSLHAGATRPAITGAAQLRHGERRPEHGLLDRAPRISRRSRPRWSKQS